LLLLLLLINAGLSVRADPSPGGMRLPPLGCPTGML
jgi:hypothetical protein